MLTASWTYTSSKWVWALASRRPTIRPWYTALGSSGRQKRKKTPRVSENPWGLDDYPEGGQLLALVDALHTGTLNDAQRETVQALRMGILALAQDGNGSRAQTV
jgi:hypothetical protein